MVPYLFFLSVSMLAGSTSHVHCALNVIRQHASSNPTAESVVLTITMLKYRIYDHSAPPSFSKFAFAQCNEPMGSETEPTHLLAG